MSARTLFPVLLLSTALTIGGCKNNSEGSSDTASSQAVKAISGKNLSAKSFEGLLDVKKRTVASDASDKALAIMGLDASGNGVFSWENKSGSDGNYTYTNLTATEADTTINIGTLELMGARTDETGSTFDRMDFRDVAVMPGADEGALKIARLSIARPDPEVANALMSMFKNVEAGEAAFETMGDKFETGMIGFGAVLLDDLDLQMEDVAMSLDTMGWGENEGDKTGTFLFEDFAMKGEGGDFDAPMNFSLASVSATGLNMEYFRKMMDTYGDMGDQIASGMPPSAPSLAGLNPYEKQFDTMAMGDLEFNYDTLSVTSDGMNATSKKKGDVLTTVQKVEPFTLQFNGEPETGDVQEMKEALTKLDMDKIVFSMASTSVLNEKKDSFDVKDTYFKFDDIMNLKMDYSGTGMSALSALSAGMENMSEDDMKAALSKLNVGSFNLSLTDESLVDKIFAAVAEQQGASPDMLRMQAKSGLMFLGVMAQNEAQTELATDLGEALGIFLDEGGTLNVRMNPETPVSMADFENIDPENFDPSFLGLKISHSK